MSLYPLIPPDVLRNDVTLAVAMALAANQNKQEQEGEEEEKREGKRECRLM